MPIRVDLSNAQVVDSARKGTHTHTERKESSTNSRALTKRMSRSKISALLVFALLSCGYIVQTAANAEPEGSGGEETDVQIVAEDDDDSVRDSEYLDIASVVV